MKRELPPLGAQFEIWPEDLPRNGVSAGPWRARIAFRNREGEVEAVVLSREALPKRSDAVCWCVAAFTRVVDGLAAGISELDWADVNLRRSAEPEAWWPHGQRSADEVRALKDRVASLERELDAAHDALDAAVGE